MTAKQGAKASNHLHHRIDAAGRSLGRVASEAARFLQGKHDPHYERHADAPVTVEVVNLRLAKFTGAKLTGKTYYRHSGYPGNLRRTSLKDMWEKSPTEVFRKVIGRMLPVTKQRARRLKRLHIVE